jgi:hypothetical protein
LFGTIAATLNSLNSARAQETIFRIMLFLNLPVDVWLDIMKHISLPDLTALRTAFASSTTPVDLSVINRSAVNSISRMLAFAKCKSMPGCFSDNGPCYKFQMYPERARKCSHTDDHGGSSTCYGAAYAPFFSDAMEFSRTFHSDPTHATGMTILANDGKPFDEWSMRPIARDLKTAGPTELIWAYIDFHTSPNEFLRFTVSTIEANIEETFSDIPRSPTCVFRTVGHNVPLKKVQWVQLIKETRSMKVTDLPKEWWEFWSTSGIWVISTFSKELITFTHYQSGEGVSQWQWKMESFKTEWKMPIVPLSGLFV